MDLKDAFEKLNYEEALESEEEALEWIAKHKGKFGHFIGGAFSRPKNLFKSTNPYNRKKVAEVSQGTKEDLNNAVRAAKSGFRQWQKVSCFQKSKYLYAIARNIQKDGSQSEVTCVGFAYSPYDIIW